MTLPRRPLVGFDGAALHPFTPRGPLVIHAIGRHYLIQGDSLEVLPTLEADSVDAIVSDPPYGLGFMGKAWDQSVPCQRMASELLRVLKPGGHALLFGGTRTYHRLAVALEDAGFEIRDCLSWLYGSGFPKSLDVAKAIDDEEAARQWAGWGTALKPAWEPILMARKPLIGTVAANVLEHGTGGINVDACRIGTSDSLNGGAYSGERRARSSASVSLDRGGIGEYAQPSGRWPSNGVLDEEAAAMLDEQSKEAKPKPAKEGRMGGSRDALGMGRGGDILGYWPADPGGGASRFFYVAKPSRAERDRGCDALPVRSGGEATDRDDGAPGTQSPRAGAGRTGNVRNVHPTVKPAALIRWLLQMVTPPGGVVLDPYCGSGTIYLAAEGLDLSVVGIERDPDYVEIALARGASAV